MHPRARCGSGTLVLVLVLVLALAVTVGALSGAVTPVHASTESGTVTIEKSGTGTGIVVATDIECGPDCAGTYPTGTLLRLMAYPTKGSTFEGWSSCEYTAGTECVVVVDGDLVIGARFAASPVETVITSSAIRSSKRRAAFEFTGSSPRGTVTFECRMDSVRFKACSSPRSYRRLSPGRHTFKVRAVDSGGVDPTPARVEFVIRR